MNTCKCTVPFATFALLTLTLMTGGCPQLGDGDNDPGNSSGFPINQNSNSNGNNNSSGGGGGGGGGTIDRSKLVRPASPTLFVADPTIGIVSFQNANTIDGNLTPNTFIDALERVRRSSDLFPMTALDLVVDRTGTLVVSNASPSLRFFNDAAKVTGIPAPNREIVGDKTLLNDNGATAYDRANDRLFVATGNRVVIYEGVSLSRNGDIAPTRFFTSPELPGGESIALGPNGDLYMPDLLNNKVLVFANAGARIGSISADRIIEPLILCEVVAVDAQDRLYIGFSDRIAVLANASTLDGEQTGFPEMQLTGIPAINENFGTTPEIEAIAVDSRGIGYVADIANAEIHIIDAIATRTGTIRADRVITGPGVVFADPRAIFLWE